LALGFFDVQRDVHVYVGLTGAFDDAVEFARAAISVRKPSSFLGCHSVHKLQAVAKMVHQKRALLFSLRFHPAPLEGYLLTQKRENTLTMLFCLIGL